MHSPKSSSPNRCCHRPRKARLSVRGLTFLPDGLTPNDLEWEDAPSVIAALEQRWAKWRRQKDAINADIHRAYLRRAEEIGREVEADRRKQMLADLDAQQAVYATADAAKNQRYLDTIVAAKQKRDADWRKRAMARLARATREINLDINRRDRELLARKRR
jgi:hypothetical protein